MHRSAIGLLGAIGWLLRANKPIVQRVMTVVSTKYIVAFGFVAIGAGLTYSMSLVPTIDYDTLDASATSSSPSP